MDKTMFCQCGEFYYGELALHAVIDELRSLYIPECNITVGLEVEDKYPERVTSWAIRVDSVNDFYDVTSVGEAYCPVCGAPLDEEACTIGKSYAELEAELAEAKRRAAWYLDTSGYCNNCTDMFTRGDKEPCISCKYHDGDKDNFTPAPVPDDFEVAENDIYD